VITIKHINLKHFVVADLSSILITVTAEALSLSPSKWPWAASLWTQPQRSIDIIFLVLVEHETRWYGNETM